MTESLPGTPISFNGKTTDQRNQITLWWCLFLMLLFFLLLVAKRVWGVFGASFTGYRFYFRYFYVFCFLLQVLFRGFSEILSKNISCISWNILRVRKATYGWMKAGKQNELIKIRNKWKTITFYRLHAQRHNCDNISVVKSNLSCMPCAASLSAGGEIKQTVI